MVKEGGGGAATFLGAPKNAVNITKVTTHCKVQDITNIQGSRTIMD